MAFLIDTNVLVYRFDPRDPVKQEKATSLFRAGIRDGQARLAHQCLVEFIAATTRPIGASGREALLTPEEAAYECEDLMRQCEILHSCSSQVRLAIRGWRTYGLSWFDAHLWSFAEYYGAERIYSEDFQHKRFYGNVQVFNPFC
jgi:predicted nucleic acid-binding protein